MLTRCPMGGLAQGRDQSFPKTVMAQLGIYEGSPCEVTWSLVSFIRAVFIHSLHTPKPTFLQPQALDRRNQISTQKPRFYLAGLGTVFTLRVSTVLEAASPSPSQHRGWGRAEKSFRDPSPFVQWVGSGGRVKALEGA